MLGTAADPFRDAEALAAWTVSVLTARGLEQVASWRMLEYWFQVELFRAVEAGQAGDWRHLGQFEQPYHTRFPKSGARTGTKWIDLVFADPDVVAPNTVPWCEFKDLGRSPSMLKINAKGLGAARHRIAQVALCHEALLSDGHSPDRTATRRVLGRSRGD